MVIGLLIKEWGKRENVFPLLVNKGDGNWQNPIYTILPKRAYLKY